VFGFLNPLAAGVFGDEEAALDEEDAVAFRLTSEEFRWRERSAGPQSSPASPATYSWDSEAVASSSRSKKLQALGLLSG
jgi:hypothetical protein